MFKALKGKTETFAVRILKMYRYLHGKYGYLDAFNQVCRSGTSIGANIAEASSAQSDADFIAKLHISLKEANETIYWLNVLYKSGYLNSFEYISISKNCRELIGMLVSILKRKKSNLRHD